jgi:hypothetical protein
MASALATSLIKTPFVKHAIQFTAHPSIGSVELTKQGPRARSRT